MESKKAIILILGLMAMVLVFSFEVSARVLTEPSSNTKMEYVEKLNDDYGGYPMNGGLGNSLPTGGGLGNPLSTGGGLAQSFLRDRPSVGGIRNSLSNDFDLLLEFLRDRQGRPEAGATCSNAQGPQ
ncbi:uncharacterized protein LOC131619579 [Vicia villosa]|uniref:uncharacterized protein LOC131619579 n=1 Tax=Vicia villosa TaxID=3911 RepID=UPI00273A7F4E|nr:uncharacterized protein LOC131619579 [Vicia villosa]